MESDSNDEDFGRLLEALRPFLHDLVIVGGWAHRLYRYRSEVSVPRHDPLFTTDTDIAIPPDARLPPNELLRQLHSYGFVEDLLGDETPPVTHYRLGTSDSGFYAEFLIPMVGGPGRPGKRSQGTKEVGSVVVQQLRHLEVLLIDPWSVMVGQKATQEKVSVKVPNAVAYIAQKLLILKKRNPSDVPKDLLYVHDTIELFSPVLDQLAALWQTRIRPRLGANAKEVEREARAQFSEVTDDIRRSGRSATGRDLEPEALRLLCEVGLDAIFFNSTPK